MKDERGTTGDRERLLHCDNRGNAPSEYIWEGEIFWRS